MRCSLLTLSSYLDRELAPEKAAEVDAHLVGCTRCQTGLGYLREETHRIGSLTRVHVTEESAHRLLSAVGLLEDGEDASVERPWVSPPAHDDTPRWPEERGSRTLPWAPRPPVPHGMPQAAAPPAHHNVASMTAPPVHPPPPPPPPDHVAVNDDPFTMTMAFDAHSATADSDLEPSLPLDTLTDDAEQDTQVAGHASVELDEHEVELPGTAHSLSAARMPVIDEDSWVSAIDAAPQEFAVEVEDITMPDVAERDVEMPTDEESDVELPAPEPSEHIRPAPMMPAQPPERSPLSTVTARLRDAVAVRFALLRGERELDPDVQIVSGTGAPPRSRHPAGPLPDPVLEEPSFPRPTEGAEHELTGRYAPVVEPPSHAEDIEDDDLDIPAGWLTPQDAAADEPYVSAQPAAVVEDDEEPAMAESTAEAIAPAVIDDATIVDDEPVIAHDDAIDSSHPRSESAASAADAARPAPSVKPGRHMRTVHGGRPHAPAWLSLEPVRALARTISRSRGPGVAVSGRDSRLWIFGGVMLVLLLIGVLLGRQATPLPVASTAPVHPAPVPQATAPVPTALTQVSPSAVPSAAATPTANPTPTHRPAPPPKPAAAAALPALTAVHALGSGARGYTVTDVSYGRHPGYYRIVFRFSDGGAGTPKVTEGIGSGGKTLYVEFGNVQASGQPISPRPGGAVISTQLLQHTPPNTTVYKLTLAHPAKANPFYLIDPTRLVIDLS